jgi:hypothetical protein
VELSENEGNYKRKAIIDASISSVDETLKVEAMKSPQPSVDEDHLCQVTSLTWYRSVVIIFS